MIRRYLMVLFVATNALNAVQITIQNNSATIISVWARKNQHCLSENSDVSQFELENIKPGSSEKIEINNLKNTISHINALYQHILIEEDINNAKLILNAKYVQGEVIDSVI